MEGGPAVSTTVSIPPILFLFFNHNCSLEASGPFEKMVKVGIWRPAVVQWSRIRRELEGWSEVRLEGIPI
jgi:hypothetical protein